MSLQDIAIQAVCVFVVVCGSGGEDTMPVSFRQDTPTEHGAEFLHGTNCNPWWYWACPVAGHYANVNHARLVTRPCVCPSAGFTFHPNFIGASGLLSALIELTSQKRTLFQESDGTLHSHHLSMGAFNSVYIGIIQCFRRKGASLSEHFITW